MTTLCRRIELPCCGAEVFLIQRGCSEQERLTWSGVPCSCGTTHMVEVLGPVSPGFGGWLPCEDAHPEFERMMTWGVA